MSEIKIARRYAKALFEKALEDKAVDTVVADVLNIQQACAGSQDLIVFLESPMLRKGVKKDALGKIFASCSDLSKKLLMKDSRFLSVININNFLDRSEQEAKILPNASFFTPFLNIGLSKNTIRS